MKLFCYILLQIAIRVVTANPLVLNFAKKTEILLVRHKQVSEIRYTPLPPQLFGLSLTVLAVLVSSVMNNSLSSDQLSPKLAVFIFVDFIVFVLTLKRPV